MSSAKLMIDPEIAAELLKEQMKLPAEAKLLIIGELEIFVDHDDIPDGSDGVIIIMRRDENGTHFVRFEPCRNPARALHV
jgi:hypothetical protein